MNHHMSHYHQDAITESVEARINEFYERVADYREKRLQRIMRLSDPGFDYLYLYYSIVGNLRAWFGLGRGLCSELESRIQNELS